MGVIGGGSANARGLRYQNLCALDYALQAIESGQEHVTAVAVESRCDEATGKVLNELDFSLLSHGRPELDVQVKSGAPSSTYSFAMVWRELWNATKQAAAPDYHFVTNRRPGRLVRELASTLEQDHRDAEDLRASLIDLHASDSDMRSQLEMADATHLSVLTRARIVISTETIDSYQEKLRLRVRSLRTQYRAGAGARSTGLVFRNLLDLLADRAAHPENVVLSLDELREVLGADERVVTEAVGERDWDVHAGLAPVVPDVDRADLLGIISRSLATTGNDSGVPCCVLHGLSGVGKTSLAAAWAADRAYEFDRVFWVSASDTTSLHRSFALVEDEIRRWLGTCRQQPPALADQGDVRERVHSLLSTCPGPWLLVLDNAVSTELVQSWVPRRGWGRVLVTTTERGCWHGPATSDVEVPSMDRAQSIELLRRRLLSDSDHSSTESSLADLAAFMQDWPLALELAAAYLNSTGLGISGIDRYTTEVQQRSLADSARSPHGYNGNLVGAINIALDRMSKYCEQDPADVSAAFGERILQSAAYLSPHQMPLQLLIGVAYVHSTDLDNLGAPGPRRWKVEPHTTPEEVLRALTRQSLARRDKDLGWFNAEQFPGGDLTVHMNEIVQHVLRDRFRYQSPDQDEAMFAGIAHHLQNWVQGAVDAGKTMHAGVLIDHARTTADHALERNDHDKHMILLWEATAHALVELGDYETAVEYLRTALSALNEWPLHQVAIRRVYVRCELAQALLLGTPHETKPQSRMVVDHLAVAAAEIPAAADQKPDLAAQYAQQAVSILRQLAIDDVLDGRTSELIGEFTELLRHLPESGVGRTARLLQQAHANFHSDNDLRITVQLCIEALSEPQEPLHAQQFFVLLSASYMFLGEWEMAFRAATELLDEHASQGPLYPVTAVEFLHLTGPYCAAASTLIPEPVPFATALLPRLTNLARTLREQHPATYSIDLQAFHVLDAAEALLRGDHTNARRLLHESTTELQIHDDQRLRMWHSLRGELESAVQQAK
ncbi:NB-ARC domain-containing protein [Saccharopolyspora sp. NFXS83]|uniref:NB-ARC domain-containing protein n=1 Tax=Saccharopolyspora sp. NFXS83 TaxID=2993560 RepID=UPI00224B31C1|nr:NB-ARC domain-containing protein [Saccharopolyspora sp. NFXS83]MCX2729475.1 NB-ARC domain-containing protein [Saccharopolyspora sp. NFXS83]